MGGCLSRRLGRTRYDLVSIDWCCPRLVEKAERRRIEGGSVLAHDPLRKTSRDIAKYLTISLKTAMTHRANLMQKLEMHSRAELIKYALRKGLIPVEGLDDASRGEG